MSQAKSQRISLPPRSPSTSSISSTSRPRRININLPTASATAAAFLSPITGESTLKEELVKQERARYTTLVSKSATSEALMKMPNVATKPEELDLLTDIPSSSSSVSSTDSIACNLPRTNPAPHRDMKLTIESQSQPPLSFASGYPIQLQQVSNKHSHCLKTTVAE
ncbi:hypothetical protein FBU30_007377 [Linnemannia zychae]|nr:hypothetical protein FBU30_007377 [Linnemannia zychae]